MDQKTYTAKDIAQILLLAQDVISLNTPIKNDEVQDSDTELGDFVEDPGPTPEEEAIINNRQELIASYLKKYLTPREQQIINLRFGLENGHVLTLEELGKMLGLTRERVRQIEAKAIRKLRVRFARNNINREVL